MAASSYDESLRRLLVDEGGYTHHPADPGGPTNFGITIADYRRYAKPNASAADVKAMRVEEAKAIYRAKYWDAQRCDELPAGVDDTVFDYGVNSGIGRSGKVLRRVLGLSDATSAIDDGVLAALRQRDAKEIILAVNAERIAFLKRLSTWPVFGAGWNRRVQEVSAFSLTLAASAPTPARQPTPPGTAPGKAVVPAAASKDTVIKAGAAASAGAAGLAHTLGAHPLITAAVFVAGLALIGLSLLALERRRRSQQEARS
ncbi:MAG TPA: glycosyl hydrolase 108 family protein [Pseudolabrys sp.]|nr:glycosyl hydrolase 108 family protein [Pseudolabrys sp.]